MSYDPFAYDSNPLRMIFEIALELNQQAYEFSSDCFNSDYVKNCIKECKTETPRLKKLELYENVTSLIDDEFGEFANGLRDMVLRFYINHKRILAFQKTNPEAYRIILEAIGLLECIQVPVTDTFIICTRILGFYGDPRIIPSWLEWRGERPTPEIIQQYEKFLKKAGELTIADYERYFDEISEIMTFIGCNKCIVWDLHKLAHQLRAYCKLQLYSEYKDLEICAYDGWHCVNCIPDEEAESGPISIRTFIKHHCDCRNCTPQMILNWRKSLNNANAKNRIKLPEPAAQNIKLGQSNLYEVQELKAKWSDYRTEITSLPRLK
jgi:hypothetical protein